MPFAPSSFLFLVVRPGAPSSFLLLVAMPGAPKMNFCDIKNNRENVDLLLRESSTHSTHRLGFVGFVAGPLLYYLVLSS